MFQRKWTGVVVVGSPSSGSAQTSADEKGLEKRGGSRSFGHLLLKVLEEERRRISRELHDDTQQALTSIILRLDMLKASLDEDQTAAKNAIDELKDIAENALEGVHAMALNLRPTMLDDLGLIPTIRWYIKNNFKDCGLAIDFRVLGSERKLSGDVELVILRIVQEALVNAAKHARATAAGVKIAFGESDVSVAVRDNGIGFSVKRALADSVDREALGLMDMRERAEIIGGRLRIESEEGKGTLVELVVPLESARDTG